MVESATMPAFTSKTDEEFFAAIGRLTISWAQIELGLDCAIDIIHRLLGGQKIHPEAPRTSLYRKVKYIRRWAKTVPEPVFREAAAVLMDAIENAAETRHDIIHGVIVELEENTGEAEMVRVIHSATKPVDKKYYKVTTVQIMQAAVDAGKLGGRSLALGTGLQELISMLVKTSSETEGNPGA